MARIFSSIARMSDLYILDDQEAKGSVIIPIALKALGIMGSSGFMWSN